MAGLALGLCLIAACDSRPAPTIELAERFDPAQLQPIQEGAHPLAEMRRIDGVPWLEIPVPREHLLPTPWPGVHQASLPGLDARRTFDHDTRRPSLSEGERHWQFREVRADALVGFELDPEILGSRVFTFVGDELMLVVPEGEAMPGDLVVRVPISLGQRTDGRWRVALGQLVGDGLAIWPGECWEVDLESGGKRRLLSTFAVEGLPLGAEEARQPLHWAVSFDGESLGEGTVVPSSDDYQFSTIALDVPPRAGRLRFEVRGEDARSAFLMPRIVPATADRAPKRPDVAIFLADTFRADLLGFETGLGSLTPNLDRFIGEAAHFERTWSSSTWTLPAHSSLFTGLQPTQHGAYEVSSRLSDDAFTLAERLRGLGYRTLALTDGAFVSRAFGIDQGFEIFLEVDTRGELDLGFDRLSRLLPTDDPRPLFLFFHTYRTHVPYFVDPETEARLGEVLGIGPTWTEMGRRFVQQAESEGVPVTSLLFTPRDFAHALALYRGGAADLDRGFARWLDVLATDGRDDGLVVFTSDHGEAFGEHDGYHGHSGDLWEEQTRVPLLIRGPGVVPGRYQHPASLVDVPRTIFALLDLSPAPIWGGRALLGAGASSAPLDRTVELFATPDSIALVEKGVKLRAAGPDLELTSVFDLATDPGERNDSRALHGAWAEERLAALRKDPSRWRERVLQGGEAKLWPELARHLDALGYTGE